MIEAQADPCRGRYGLKSGCDIAWEGAPPSGILVVRLPDAGTRDAPSQRMLSNAAESKRIYLTSPTTVGPGPVGLRAILAGSACQNAVASALSPWRNWNNLRQYLREWLYDGSDRTSPCGPNWTYPLLRSIAPVGADLVAFRPPGPCGGSNPQRGPDHCHRHQRSLPQLRHPRGLAHPARRPARLLDGPHRELLQASPAVPEEMTVIVLCDRGIASPKLWKQILAQGWHPGMRYRKNITFCADGGRRLPAVPIRGSAAAPPSAPPRKRRCTLGGLVLRTGGTKPNGRQLSC